MIRITECFAVLDLGSRVLIDEHVCFKQVFVTSKVGLDLLRRMGGDPHVRLTAASEM